ncbi:MAG: phosphoribosylformimino-5-aminoimidazole carboxamide ribotide isomerase [Pelagibacterales bacterium]|nr:phosphoribosylformimino-5-aminoimidazole carboxamide ribotide isomerase [Pelagibacterales bacterium]
MIIFPAIDIKAGNCVRLLKGDFNKITQYKKSPLDQASEFSTLGFKNLHIVDLDGALTGRSINTKIIKEIILKTKIKIQLGGGIRSLEQIEIWLNAGVDKVVLGTAALENLNFLKKACEKFKKKIAVALDVKKGHLSSSGWKKNTLISPLDYLKEIDNFGVSRVIYTDIDKDGSKLGASIDETYKLSLKTKIPMVISGGVGSIEEVKKIISLGSDQDKSHSFGKKIEGVIVGKAIYDGNINIKTLSKII